MLVTDCGMVIASSWHLLKALKPIVWRPSLSVIVFRPEFRNALSPMVVSVVGRVMLCRCSISWKAEGAMVVMPLPSTMLFT